MEKPRYLISCIGTTGDALPYIGLGAALRSAGHEVVIAANPAFRGLVDRAGLGFEELGDADRYREAMAHPDLYHPTKSIVVMAEKLVFPALERSVAMSREYAGDGNTVVVASTLSFGPRIAYDLARFPLVTVHLQPFLFPTVHELRIAPGPNLPAWAPMPLKRAYLRICDVLADRYYGPPIDALRDRLGLAPIQRLFSRWRNAPELILGLFPDWFAQPQPDWPPQARLTEFPLYDQSDAREVPADLAAYLDEPSPLLICTIGSAAVEPVARRFFAESVAASQILGCRALLLTGTRAHLPAALPPKVRHYEYVPLSKILPRASALVHHGGLGTSSLGLAAGVPQLALPFGHDQFDNAARLERLGVGKSLGIPQYEGAAVAEILKSLMESGEVRARCADYKARISRRKPFEESLRALEEFAARH